MTLGERHLERGRYQDAIAEFRRAYELRADPRFLFDIAESYRQLGAVDRALFFYDRYLASAPEAPDRDDVRLKMAELERVRSRGLPLAPAPPPSLAHDVVVVPIGAAGDEAPARHRRPIWKRWWFWTIVGAAAITAGVITAAAVAGGSNPAVPETQLGDKRFY